MIQKLRVRNFQSHRDTTIEFHPGVNAFVGVSGAGKTVLMRALLWVITNKPSGEEFRSHWGGDTCVQLWVEDVCVERGRTNSDNYYAVERPDEKRKEFRAFGQGVVPDEIADILNFKLQPVDSELPEFNIGAQMDRPFLLSSSSGDVAKTFNKAVSLEGIDSATSNIRKKKLDVDRRLRSAEENLVALNTQLLGFDYLDAMEADVVRLEDVQAKRAALSGRREALQTAVAKIKALHLLQQKHLALLGATNALQQAFDTRGKQRDGWKKIAGLSALRQQLERETQRFETSGKLARAEGVISALTVGMGAHHAVQQKVRRLTEIGNALVAASQTRKTAAALVASGPQLEAALAITADRDALDKKIRRLDRVLQTIELNEKEVGAKVAKYVALEAEFVEAMGDTCLLCGSSVKAKTPVAQRTTRTA